MSCVKQKGATNPPFTGHFHYTFCYPAADAAGSPLTHIHGMYIDVLEPGACEWTNGIAFVPFPEQCVDIEVSKDGDYGVRHRCARHCTTGAPSVPTSVSVHLTPPGVSGPGKAKVPCPNPAPPSLGS